MVGDTTDVAGAADVQPSPECQSAQDCFDKVGPLGPCQAAVCVAGESVCVVEAVSDGTGCEDGSACTAGDQCTAGECVPGAAPVCDDGNPCTDDGCDPEIGCTVGESTCPCLLDGDCEEFDDGDLCNGTLICRPGEDGLTVCEIDPETVVTCEGDDACTEPGTCEAGVCSAGEPLDCDDGNPCTDDSCDPVSGCGHVDNESCGECVGIECLGCAFGVDCASEGPFIDDTCCAVGDNLLYLQDGLGGEVVDIDTDGVFSVTCGGFGADVHDVSSPGSPKFLGGMMNRCQRMAFGPLTPTGKRVVYITHHGDSFVQNPILSVHTLDVSSGVATVAQWTEPGVIYEGMAWADGYLFVAAHGGGVRIYTTDPQGGLKVFTFGGPLPPKLVQSLDTGGKTTDVIAHQGRVYVALGGGGVDVFDASVPGDLAFVGNIDTLGSVQAAAADGDLLALAAWSHVAVHSISTLQLLGTEQVRSFPAFDEILGVQVVGNHIFVGEWEGMHILEYRQGRVGPDFWIEEELIAFDGNEMGARAVIMRNLGPLDLEISDIQPADADAWSVDKTSATIPPGEAAVVELLYEPGVGSSGISKIVFHTNDPDAYQNPFELHLVAGDSGKLDIGDTLPASFGFLDPTGGGQVENLQGHVVVLAYFALF